MKISNSKIKKLFFLCSKHLLKFVSTRLFRIKLLLQGYFNSTDISVYGKVNILLTPGSTLILKNSIRLNSGFKANPVGSSTSMSIWVGSHGTLSIGNNCGLSNSIIVATKNVKIEDNVIIGGGCTVIDSDFHPIHSGNRIHRTQEPVSKEVIINKCAFIGCNVIILKGVTIGENSIIGAGSVVTRTVPANEIWAGNPACKIGRIK